MLNRGDKCHRADGDPISLRITNALYVAPVTVSRGGLESVGRCSESVMKMGSLVETRWKRRTGP